MRKRETTKRLRQMWSSIWDSLDRVSFLSSVSNWFIAIFGVCALILSNRKDVLGERKSTEEDKQRDTLISDNNLETAEAKRESALANERSLHLAKEIADKTLEIERLKDRQRPREITAEQKAAFKKLTASSAKGRVAVQALVGERDEPYKYAVEIRAMLEEAGYQVESLTSFISTGGELSGVWLKVTDIKSAPAHAAPLQQAFKSIDIEASGTNTEGMDGETVMISVYKKEWRD